MQLNKAFISLFVEVINILCIYAKLKVTRNNLRTVCQKTEKQFLDPADLIGTDVG